MKLNSYNITIALTLAFFSEAVMAGKNNASCIYLHEQAPIYKNNNILALILDSAFIDNDCPRKHKWSIKGAKELNINGITVLYNSGDNIDLIKSIANKNIMILKQYLPKTKQDELTANFAEASLSAFTASIERLCNIKIKLTASKNKKFWLYSNKAIQRSQYCLNTAVILAGNYVNLKYVDGVLYEDIIK